MGINILLFVVFQIGVEPWRRKRLVKGFEDKVMEALERDGSGPGPGAKIVEMHETQDARMPSIEVEATPTLEVGESVPEEIPLIQEVAPVTEAASAKLTPAMHTSKLDNMRETLSDMFSERQITIRRVDLTTAMLEGTAAGVAFVGVLVLILRPR